MEIVAKYKLANVKRKALEDGAPAKQELFAVVERIRRRNPALDSDEVMRELEEVEQRGSLA